MGISTFGFLSVLLALLLGLWCARTGQAAGPPGGALTGERFRVIVSTDIGGSDPDDFQSMVHYLLYADLFETEGLISSPPHAGRKQHLLEVLDAYATDYSKLRAQSARFPSPDKLRAITKQGAVDAAPPAGFSTPTEGSRWLVERARAHDPRPLWVLVWGSITDVAQALHDAPDIKPKLRVYFISSWNRRSDQAARDYVVQQHPDLWLIEAETTFRGMYVGGNQEGDLGNREFIARHVQGHGALGDLLAAKKADIKMGDTPSVLYLLRGDAENPAGESWGGAFVRPDSARPYWTDNPDPALREGNFPGAKTVNRWREEYLRDWQQRLEKARVQGYARERVQEKLDRGLIAMPTAGGDVYVGWRLLQSDPPDTAFHLYRRTDETTPVRLNRTPLIRTTDFVDANPPGGKLHYLVRPVNEGREGEPSETASATPADAGQAFLRVPLDGDHTVQKVGIADLTGDGRCDFVIKQPNANVDPYVKYWKPSPGTYQLEAYRHDGTFLWRRDLGWSIEQGIWYSPYVVFDFDGDGRAEIAVKTGEGDPRDPDGRVASGPEWLSILDGLTGEEITRAPWPSRDGFPDYNYFCRNQLGVAYLDGKTPALIVNRGTYNTIKVVAYEFHNRQLRELWSWNDREAGPRYRGQGAHILRAADLDDDGRDEVILGAAVLDDNGTGLWSLGMGHPDHVTVGGLDPARPGLQIQYGFETRQSRHGICMVDGKTGKMLWGLDQPTIHIHSSGLCADIDPAHPGVESYGGERDFPEKRWLFNAQGQVLGTDDLGGLAPRAVYWDGDPQRELLARGRLRDYGGGEHPTRIEGAVVAIADILGDWREEILTSVAGELRLYTTTIPATDRRVCLMQDPIYRLDVAGAAQGYFQVPGLTRLPSAKGKQPSARNENRTANANAI